MKQIKILVQFLAQENKVGLLADAGLSNLQCRILMEKYAYNWSVTECAETMGLQVADVRRIANTAEKKLIEFIRT